MSPVKLPFQRVSRVLCIEIYCWKCGAQRSMLSSVGLVNHWRCTGNGALHSLIFSVAEEQPDIPSNFNSLDAVGLN